MSYGFQVSPSIRMVCTGDDFEFQERRDGLYASKNGKNNYGVCLTGILALDTFVEGRKGFRIIFVKDSGEVVGEVKSKKGQLVLFKSRFLRYRVKFEAEKSFLIQYWVNGPLDIKFGRF